MFATASLNIDFSIEEARTEVLVSWYDDVVVVLVQGFNKCPLVMCEVGIYFLPMLRRAFPLCYCLFETVHCLFDFFAGLFEFIIALYIEPLDIFPVLLVISEVVYPPHISPQSLKCFFSCCLNFLFYAIIQPQS